VSKLFTLVSVIVALTAGCAASTGKGPIPDVAAGKADGTLEVTDHDDFAFERDLSAELAPGVGHAWTFELAGAAEVAFETSADAPVDTVLYVHDAAGDELAMDDDGGEGYFSSLRVSLEAGRYRVTVLGYGDATGPFRLKGSCAGAGCGEGGTEPGPAPVTDDPWALAKDVHRMNVEFTDATPIPESFIGASDTGSVRLSGPEWWQRWSGGATQSFDYSKGSDYGKRCASASAIRLQAIWDYEETGEDGVVRRPGREAFQALLDGSGWTGTMYNWTEDVSGGGYPVFSPATMWAWRTTAVKWINVVHPNGSCDLPTLELVEAFSETCLEQASHEDGAIEGCQASAE
jgi:hypothetical protein